MEEIDLGVSRAFVFPGPAERAAVILPGAGYSVQAPLLWFSRLVLAAEGWTVLAVDDRYGRGEDPRAWVEARAAAALYHLGNRAALVMGKYISTLAAPLVIQRGLVGIWLTPLLRSGDSVIVDALRRATSPTLLVGGTADPEWDGGLARSLPVEVLEVPGADHSLQRGSDPATNLDILHSMSQGLAAFLRRLREGAAVSS